MTLATWKPPSHGFPAEVLPRTCARPTALTERGAPRVACGWLPPSSLVAAGRHGAQSLPCGRPATRTRGPPSCPTVRADGCSAGSLASQPLLLWAQRWPDVRSPDSHSPHPPRKQTHTQGHPAPAWGGGLLPVSRGGGSVTLCAQHAPPHALLSSAGKL